MMVDREWRDAVRAACDPVFAAADVGFEWNQSVDFERNLTMLWEADPATMTAELSVEGSQVVETTIRLTGDGTQDGLLLAARFAEILAVS